TSYTRCYCLIPTDLFSTGFNTISHISSTISLHPPFLFSSILSTKLGFQTLLSCYSNFFFSVKLVIFPKS
ncbi:unnamed protein product, partial [Musa textilis]